MAEKTVKQWCDHHWAKIRDSRSFSSVAAQLELLTVLMRDERFMRRAGWNPETGALADANPTVLNALIAEITPICCWVGEPAMATVYEMAKRAATLCGACKHPEVPGDRCAPESEIAKCVCACHKRPIGATTGG